MNIPFKTGVRLITGIEDPVKAEKEFVRFYTRIFKQFIKETGRIPKKGELEKWLGGK